MNHHGNAAGLVVWLCLSLCAGAAVKKSDIRITVLDSQTRSATIDNSGVEKNCDGVNYDAYCHNSKTAEITNLLLVREGDGPPFWVSCNVDTKWSRCEPLEKGRSFDSRREKRGLSVYYEDDNGKMRKQLYAYVSERVEGKSEAVAAAEIRANQNPQNQIPSTQVQATQIQRNQIQPSQVRPNPAPAAEGERTSEPQLKIDDAVKCSFASTPTGAEITVDGKYVGSTPSALSLSVGTHAVQVSLPGFVEWKRQLTVSSGSELTVNAVLQNAH